jgi:hypothetical protein
VAPQKVDGITIWPRNSLLLVYFREEKLQPHKTCISKFITYCSRTTKSEQYTHKIIWASRDNEYIKSQNLNILIGHLMRVNIPEEKFINGKIIVGKSYSKCSTGRQRYRKKS